MKALDKLRAVFSKRQSDVILHYPLGFGTRNDAHWLSGIFNKEFIEELRSRGYDPETMKFEVCPKIGNEKFSSQREGG